MTRPATWLRIATMAVAALAVAAVLAAGWFGVAWYRAANDTDQIHATMRNDVLRDARQVAVNLEQIDYRSLDDDLERWEASITGQLLEVFLDGRDRYADQIRQMRAVAEVDVVDAAVTQLNPTAGTAEVLLFVNLTTTQQPEGDDKPTTATKRQRIKLELTRTDNGWKASAAGSVGAR